MSMKRNAPVLIGLLILMCCVGVAFGIWLFRAHFILLGCLYVGVWLWNAQRFALWLMAPSDATVSEVLQPSTGAQRVILAIICLAAAGISAWGAYWWYVSPEDWQAGLVFILFGLLIFGPVTIREVQLRRKLRTH